MVTMWNRLSSTVKITLFFLSIMTFFLVTSAAAIIYLSHTQWLSHEKNEVMEKLHTLADSDPSDIRESMASLSHNSEDVVSYYLNDGESEYATGIFNTIDVSAFLDDEITEVGEMYYLTTYEIGDFGFMAYTEDITLYILYEKNQINVAMLVLLVALMCSTVVIYYAVKIVQRPIKQLIDTTEQITIQNLNQKITLTGNKNDPIVQLSRTLNDLLERLRISAEKLKQFNHDVSHELRTPLAVIATDLELAIKMKDFEKLNRTKDEVAALTDLIENVLFIAAQEKSPSVASISMERLCVLIGESIQKCERLYTNKRVSVEKIMDKKGYSIVSNEVLLSNMFFILLENAYKHAPKGGKVKVVCKKGVITLSNPSEPITVKQLKQITVPFYKADTSRADKGFGLGLSIAQKISESLNVKLTYAYSEGLFECAIVFGNYLRNPK